MRPSEFVHRKFHPLYGRVNGVPFVALAPAFIIVTAYDMIVKAETKFFANDVNIWSGKSPSEIISSNQQLETASHWGTLVLALLAIYGISLVKYLWHSVLRKITDKIRTDGQIANPAPVQFFIFHTSGVASWLGITMLIFAVTSTFFPGRPFTVMDEFIKENFLWGAALGAVLLLIMAKYYESNTQIFMKIYKNEGLVRRVRAASFIIPIGLFVFIEIAGVFSVWWLVKTASMIKPH